MFFILIVSHQPLALGNDVINMQPGKRSDERNTKKWISLQNTLLYTMVYDDPLQLILLFVQFFREKYLLLAIDSNT